MAELHDLQIADANNTTRWPSGTMTVNQIDNSGRAVEGILAREYRDNNGSNATTGSGTAYVLTLNRSGVTSNANVGRICVRFHAANSGACTLQINGLTAKPLRKKGNAALVTGDIMANDIIDICYNPATDAFQLLGV